jgi:hypothetical protein
LHGVVFDIFGGSQGEPARRHRPEGAQALQAVAQIVGFFWKGRKFLIFQWGLTDTLSASRFF